MGVFSWIDKLKFRIISLDTFLDFFPVNFEFLTWCNNSLVCNDDRIIKIFFTKDYFTIFVVLILLLFSCFTFCLLVSLFNISLSRYFSDWQSFVSNTSYCFPFELKLFWVFASINNVLYSPFISFNIVTIQEMGDSNVTIFTSWYLISEELIFD